jgi:hypothetical protein
MEIRLVPDFYKEVKEEIQKYEKIYTPAAKNSTPF